MPLTGEAKKAYQRTYTHKAARNARAIADHLTDQLKPLAKASQRLSRRDQQRNLPATIPKRRHRKGAHPRKVDVNVQHVSQQVLQKALERNGLNLDLTLKKIVEKHEATRWFNAAQIVNGKSMSEALVAGDNDAQLRAAEMAMKVYERAGVIPSNATDEGPRSSGARVRMVQIAPDGTETWLEIG